MTGNFIDQNITQFPIYYLENYYIFFLTILLSYFILYIILIYCKFIVK